MADPALLAEAYKRGLLPPDKKAAYEEAMRRGLLAGGAPKQAAPSVPANRTMGENVLGFMSTLNRSLLIGDEISAGATTARNVLTGRTPLADVRGDFDRNMAREREQEATYSAEHPVAANVLARGIGNSALMAVPGAKTVQGGTLAGNMARGALGAATAGAAYGLADAGTIEERGQAARRNALNPVTLAVGAGAGALSPRAARPKAAKPVGKPGSDAQILADVGVSTSVPQRMGRAAKGVEDIGKRFPIVGQAVGGFNDRQIGQLNRAVGLKALEPVGMSLPKNVQPGFDMVEHVDDALGSVYKQASDLVPVVPPQAVAPFKDELAQIAERKADLPETVARQFDSIVSNRLARLDRPDASGALIKEIHGELGSLQAEAARKGETTLSGMLGDTRRAIMGIIERANPEAGALIKKADKGWQVYSIMNDAAAAASAKGGVFLPGQLNTQVRSAARGMGSNMAGKGKGPLQDIATAASRTIPDTFGNPGTANAALVASGLTGLATNAPATVTVAAGLTAAATPYFLAGRKIIERLPPSAGAAQLRQAQAQLAKLAQSDPAVAALQRQVAARLERLGALAGSQPERRNALARAPQ